MIGKKLINTGGAAVENLPSGYFNTVLYTGNGGTQRIGGYINRGAVFDGSSSYVSTSNPLSTGNVAYSISAWIYLNTSSHTGGIYTIWDGGTNAGTYLFFKVEGGKISIGNYGSAVTSANTLSVGQWVHVVVTRDTSNNVVLYVNRSSDTTGALSLNLGNHSPKIGALNTTTQNLNGKIDQVRIFDKALSQNEVDTLYGETHASTTISTTDIFNDNSGVALYQLDGNANDTGGVSGYIGEGAIFNGSSSSISTDVIPLSGTSFSISSWVYRNTNNTVSIIFGQSDQSNGTPFLSIGFDTNNNLELLNRNASSTGLDLYLNSTTHGVGINAWYNIVWTCSATESKLYVNGVLKDTTSFTANNYSFSSQYIGARMRTTGVTNNWNGKLDQVRIYSKALSQNEVDTLYGETASSNITISDLVAYYPMEGTSLDQEGSYHGTDTNVEYNYNGTASNVTYQEATNFTPDLIWIKSRNHANNHFLYDSVRGVNKAIYIQAEPEITRSGVTSFDSNGFTLGSSNDMNLNGSTFVSWCFNAADTTTTIAANTVGNTIASDVRANQDAGFSIVKYTGNSTDNATVGTGLSSASELVIVKDLTGANNSWCVGGSVVGNGNNLYLDESLGTLVRDRIKSVQSNTFTLSNHQEVNSTYNYIAYNFHSVDGIQKVGSYTGGTANKVVETNFEPAWILIKGVDSSTADHWVIYDNKRSPTNPMDELLLPNLSAAENVNNTNHQINFLSNGFQLITTSTQTNASGGDYIYLAIAADPDTTTPTVEDSFEVVTYTGNGGTQEIDTGFKPDLVWLKSRSATWEHFLQDSIRGAGNYLRSNSTGAEGTTSPNIVSSFDTNGFTVLGNGNSNNNNDTYVAWCWKAGDHDDNLPQINTEGTIDSIVSVNDAAGFSIVKYTAGGAANVGHGLSSAPELIITKNIDTSEQWFVYAEPVGTQKFLGLNTTSAATSNSGVYTDVNATTFTNNISSTSRTYINYCFTSITGYQKIGSYTGTGAVNNQINVGFQPRFVMQKRSDSTGSWNIIDSQRGDDNYLSANLSNTEGSMTASSFHLTSTGFTLDNSFSEWNASGGTYIYLAIK